MKKQRWENSLRMILKSRLAKRIKSFFSRKRKPHPEINYIISFQAK